VRGTLETLLAGKSFHILPEFLNVSKLPHRGISTVVMVHVLDHLTDPKALLLELKKKLAPEAVLLFVTHDETSLLAKVTRKPLAALLPAAPSIVLIPRPSVRSWN